MLLRSYSGAPGGRSQAACRACFRLETTVEWCNAQKPWQTLWLEEESAMDRDPAAKPDTGKSGRSVYRIGEFRLTASEVAGTFARGTLNRATTSLRWAGRLFGVARTVLL